MITLTREEAQELLDALENLASMAGAAWTTDNPIETLRARLSAPEPEEKKYTEESCPVCGYYCLGKGGVYCIDKPKLCGINTAPPQRKEWQGLTGEEAAELCHAPIAVIEAKLKEKNNA